MASAVQRLLPWRRKTLTVSGKEPTFHNCTYLGPVSVLDAHNTRSALRSAWKRHLQSRGSVGCQVTLRLKVNRLEMTFTNMPAPQQTADPARHSSSSKCDDFFLHRIVTCQGVGDGSSTPKSEEVAPHLANAETSEVEEEGEAAAAGRSEGKKTAQPPPPSPQQPAAADEAPVADTLAAWSYKHETKRKRIVYKAHVVNFHSTKRAADFLGVMTDKLVFTLEEYRRERLQRQSSRARLLRTRSVESDLPRSGTNGSHHRNCCTFSVTPLRKSTLSTAKHFKPESKAAPKLQILNEAAEEEEDELTVRMEGTTRRLSRLGLALVD